MTTEEVKEVPMDARNKALREALKCISTQQARVVLASCGLTEEERRCLLEHKDGADLQWISEKLKTSDRTTDRRRAAALTKVRKELEQD